MSEKRSVLSCSRVCVPLVAAAVFVLMSVGSALARTGTTIVFRDAPRAAPSALGASARPLSRLFVTDQIRRLTTISSSGTRYTLYAGPTRTGGSCAWWKTGGAGFGSCRRPQPGLQMAGFGARARSLFLGSFSQTTVARVVVEFADHGHVSIPFVWVTKPVSAGLFLYKVPRSRRAFPHQPVAVALYGRDGRPIETIPIG